jgi:hypothetical protein
MFSRAHIDQHVIPALRKEKQSHKVWRASTTKSSCPRIFYGPEDKGLYFCFGCKKAAAHIPSHHLQDCPHATLHIDTLKKLLGDPTEEEEDAAVDVDALKKEIETLKKKLKVSKITEEAAEEQRDERDDFLEKYFRKSFENMDEEEREALIEEGYKGALLN